MATVENWMLERLQRATEELTPEECWRLLASHQVGRLAVDVAGRPDIFPINYVVDRHALVFRSAAGTKLAAAILDRHVAFEIDGYEPERHAAWSVVVKGTAVLIEGMDATYEAEDLPLFPWVAFPKPDFVRIVPELVTGRRFHVVDDVTPDDSVGWSSPPAGSDSLAVRPSPHAEHHEGAPRLHPD